jgi:hypothetical protein
MAETTTTLADRLDAHAAEIEHQADVHDGNLEALHAEIAEQRRRAAELREAANALRGA